jgi:hypothetical protein
VTNETSVNDTENGAAEQAGAGMERIGETGVQFRMEFPHETVREDFLVAFQGWLAQYQRATETAYLVQALVAEKVAAAQGEDTSGFYYSIRENNNGSYSMLLGPYGWVQITPPTKMVYKPITRLKV